MSVLKLTVIYFDSMENSVTQAEYILEELLFMDDKEQTAYSKLNQYIQSKDYKLYLGWNKEVYPKLKVEQVNVR